ncbi:Complex I intermediate-associated protein 30 [Fusarium oxysporum f. sp. albedinis]|nr:Complex I intermediate-associated protein 30 [Fusarium oxysporum f. sp. albedinis]
MHAVQISYCRRRLIAIAYDNWGRIVLAATDINPLAGTRFLYSPRRRTLRYGHSILEFDPWPLDPDPSPLLRPVKLKLNSFSLSRDPRLRFDCEIETLERLQELSPGLPRRVLAGYGRSEQG